MKKNVKSILFIAAFLVIVPFISSIKNSNGNGSKNLYNNIFNFAKVSAENNVQQPYISDSDVYLMSQVVFAESGAEPYSGKVAVASVILNRLKDPRFPKTIEGIIKQKNAFSCISNGKINVIPNEDSYRAVLDALKGSDPTDKAVFFYNPKTSTSSWMKCISKSNIKNIGQHVFFNVH